MSVSNKFSAIESGLRQQVSIVLGYHELRWRDCSDNPEALSNLDIDNVVRALTIITNTLPAFTPFITGSERPDRPSVRMMQSAIIGNIKSFHAWMSCIYRLE